MRTGLVLEGGGMRGMFTVGALDTLMRNGIHFDGAVGVSAGAVFGCNLKSQQIGRALRYNLRFCRDKRYMSLHSLITTGDYINEQFCYHVVPRELDVFDTNTFATNPMDFWVVCTDAKTGLPLYHKCPTGNDHDLTWMRASASMPLVSKVVQVDGYALLDGGISDSIPLQWLENQGFDRIVVILTQCSNYRKPKSHLMPWLCRKLLAQYPAVAQAMAQRPEKYNAQLDYVLQQERAGKIIVLRPSCNLHVGRVESNPDKLQAQYELGVAAATAQLNAIKSFVTN